MSIVDELSVSPEQIAQQVQQDVAEDGAVDALETEITVDTDGDTGLEGEAEFWQNDDVENNDSSEELESDVPAQVGAPAATTIKFKADGIEQEISIEEAQKQLSLVAGARKAFSDRAKIKSGYDKAQAEIKRLQEFEQNWRKLESLKGDDERLFQVLTGKNLEDMLQKRLEREKLYASATPEERQLLDYEQRMEQMERRLEQEQKDRDRARQEAEQIRFETDQAAMKSKFNTAFNNAKVSVADDQVQHRLDKYIWRNAIGDLKDYHKQGIELTDKVITKAFADVAATVRAVYGKEVDKGVKQVIEQKKATAKEKAQVASTANYNKTKVDPELLKMNPNQLFDRMFGKRAK